jgi:acyl carrier protein
MIQACGVSNADAAVALSRHEELVARVDSAIDRARRALLAQQHREGYWQAALEAHAEMNAEYIIFNRFMELPPDPELDRKLAKQIRETQQVDGSWALFPSGEGHLSTTIEAYFGLKLTGMRAGDEPMMQAQRWILSKGGIACRQQEPRRDHGEPARSGKARPRRRTSQFRDRRCDDHRHKSGRPGRRVRLRSNLSAAGRAGRLRQNRRAAVGQRRDGRRAASGDGEPVWRPSRDGRPSRRIVPRCHRMPDAGAVEIVNEAEIKALYPRELHKIAPEVESSKIDPAVDLREQFDLDSMDILNLAIAIHEATGVDIPEVDYPQMTTLNGCVAYLHSRANG